jgi:hypothetical protein
MLKQAIKMGPCTAVSFAYALHVGEQGGEVQDFIAVDLRQNCR